MNGNHVDGDSEGPPVPQSLADLLWEPEGELARALAPEGESHRIRDAARRLQQQQSEHRQIDVAAEWVEVGIELPRNARRRTATPERTRKQMSAFRTESHLADDASELAATTLPEHARACEFIARIVQLLASPELQRRLSSRLPGRSLQREMVRLWFVQYRPVQCEDLFSANAASGLRRLSARMRQLLPRTELWSFDIDLLLADHDWRELTDDAEIVLAQIRPHQGVH